MQMSCREGLGARAPSGLWEKREAVSQGEEGGQLLSYLPLICVPTTALAQAFKMRSMC